MLTKGTLGQYTLGGIGTVVNYTQANPTQAIYRPRMLVSLTVGVEIERYSTEDLEA